MIKEIEKLLTRIFYQNLMAIQLHISWKIKVKDLRESFVFLQENLIFLTHTEKVFLLKIVKIYLKLTTAL